MRIKIGVVENDSNFVKRFSEVMSEKYPQELEIYCFPDMNKAQVAAKKFDLNLLLIGDLIDGTPNKIPKTCRIAYLKESKNSETKLDHIAVCKYQSVDEWHKFILTICKDYAFLDKSEGGEVVNNKTKVCIFTSAGGGVGASTTAAAFSTFCAEKGKAVLYMNFETFPTTKEYFEGDSSYNFDDIIYALRSQKYNLETIVNRAIVKDTTGVYFVNPCKVPPDMFSVTGEEISKICEQVQNMDKFEVVVIDINFESTENIVVPFLNSDKVVLVSDGSTVSNEKTRMLLQTLPLICDVKRECVYSKSLILYNCFSSKSGKIISDTEIGKLGGINSIEHEDKSSLLKAISSLSVFEKLADELHV